MIYYPMKIAYSRLKGMINMMASLLFFDEMFLMILLVIMFIGFTALYFYYN